MNILLFSFAAFCATIAVVEGNICCMSNQFEAIEGNFNAYYQNGKPTVVAGATNLSYDGVNKRLYSASNNDQTHEQTIIDYKTGFTYVIINGVCHKSQTNGTMSSNCIPESAQLVQTAYLGNVSKKIPTKVYVYAMDDNEIYATITEGCIPIVATVKGSSQGVDYANTIGYFNITSGIRNPQVFVPPSSCNGPNTHSIPSRRMKKTSLFV